MHETLVYTIMIGVAIGFVIQCGMMVAVAFNVYGKKANRGGNVFKNFIDGKILEMHYKHNRVKD